MAPRPTARRLLVAAPVLVLAAGLAACSPPHEKPSSEPVGTTLPSFKGPDEAPKSSSHATPSAHATTSAPQPAGETLPASSAPAGSTTAGTPAPAPMPTVR